MHCHDLLKLFDGLESGTQDLLAQGLAGLEHLLFPQILEQSMPGADTVLRAILRHHSNSFTHWRYLYEDHRGTFATAAFDLALTVIIDAYDKR